MERKRISLLGKFVLAGAACSLPVGAMAAEGFYIAPHLGVNQAEDQSFKVYGYEAPIGPGLFPPPDGATISEVEYDLGYLGGLSFGYDFGMLRPELEISFRTDDVDKQSDEDFEPLLTPASEGKGDSTETLTGMFNLWVDFLDPSTTALRPYVGGGAGMAKVEIKDATYLGDPLGDQDDEVFVYQFGAGVGYALSEQVELSLDYRYLKSDDVTYDFDPSTPGEVESEYEAHSAMFSLRYYFSAPPAPPPPPVAEPEPVAVVPVVEEPPPPPPPPPPCQGPDGDQAMNLEGCKTGDTIVLRGVNFDFNKSSLTVNAKTILDMVAEALTKRTDIKVEVDGHTDSKGSDSYNQSLSEKRAASVMQYLVSKGIDASRMTAVGMGESQPVADNETDEGRELNRRVELKVLEAGGGGVVVEPPAADAAAPEEAVAP